MSEKKILEKSPMSGIAVPIAIVLVGILIVFGVTKMLSSGKNHRDLVEELNSKTFGNRWVAAYELSKYLAASRIPEAEIPWVVENLIQVYDQSVDPRTRNFIVLALGTLKTPESFGLINKALDDQDPQVRFNAVVTLGNLPPEASIDWAKLETLLSSTDDEGLKQVILLTIAARHKEGGEKLLYPYLNSQQKMLRYSAAIGLISYGAQDVNPVLEELLDLSYDQHKEGELNGAQVEALKVNVLTQIEKNHTKSLLKLVESKALHDSNIRVSTQAKQVVNLLKN